MVGVICRRTGGDVLLGAGDRGPLALAGQLSACGDDPLRAKAEDILADELAAARGEISLSDPRGEMTPLARLSAGTQVPAYRSGDEETGVGSARVGLDGRLYAGPLAVRARPITGLDVAPGASPYLAVEELWAGVFRSVGDAGHVHADFGLRRRWLGPTRRGSLTLTDNAAPAPAGSLGGTGRLWRLGRLYGEVGAGWLSAERADVERPGWLWMDLRWSPLLQTNLPQIEIGASRVGIFGGVGRPTPSLGQLILPTDPHIEDDPDALLPDQDELAALDFRLTLPLWRWWPGSPLDYIEGWWQYGGEDVIGREILGIPTPSLAGVANIYGGEVAASAGEHTLLLTIEWARLLDDYFRWYTGHRVYHDGFTRFGRTMGHAIGGDALEHWAALTWLAPEIGAGLEGGRTLRVGVIEDQGTNLFALMDEERRWWGGARGWTHAGGRWWTGAVSAERITGLDFVPGADGWTWRVSAGMGAP